MWSTLNTICTVFALVIVSIGLGYYLLSMGVGVAQMRQLKRQRARNDVRAPRSIHRRLTTEDLAVYVLIPCLNEATVIGSTVSELLKQPGDVTIFVIDDGSDDGTGDAAVAASGDGACGAALGNNASAIVHRRELPLARQGKGEALNDALLRVRDDVRARSLDPNMVIVAVMDADGRLSPGALDSLAETFTDPSVGAAQIPVRIRNRGSWLTNMQDLEFWALSATTQIGRMRTSTVSLGGNGQFSRLSALLSVGNSPWSTSLTEDLDLSITLATKGWRLTTIPGAFVDQQGLTELKPLIRQRTRWFQGHITCNKRIPEIWRSAGLSNAAALEMTSYLLVPTALVLPWSIIGHYALFHSIAALFRDDIPALFGSAVGGRIAYCLFWYITGFIPNVLLGLVYFRRDRSIGRLKAIGLAHLMIPYNYVSYIAAWRALWRVARGKTSWAKTDRVVESTDKVVGTPLASLVSVEGPGRVGDLAA